MEITEQDINKRAYEIYEMRKHSELWQYGALGTPVGDYFQAEKELHEEECAQRKLAFSKT